MKVRILSDVSTNAVTFKAGEVVEVSDVLARGLIAQGLGEPLEAPQPEAATLERAPEQATQPRARRRG